MQHELQSHRGYGVQTSEEGGGRLFSYHIYGKLGCVLTEQRHLFPCCTLSQGAWWNNITPLGDLTIPVCTVCKAVEDDVAAEIPFC